LPLSRVIKYRYTEFSKSHRAGDTMADKFGTRIKELRTAKGMTLDDLAKATGSARSYIWELENKNPPRPSAEKLSAIAKALDVTVDYLFGRDEQSVGDATDLAFFREYTDLPPETKEQLRQMAKILGAKKDK
jgi:transcriptional regulator with XRE-family HTH domain